MICMELWVRVPSESKKLASVSPFCEFNSVFFCRVKYAVNTETNEAVAIKILDKDKIQTRNMGAQIKKEISIMKMISHHHVVSVKDVFATSAKIFIVLEFVGGGELFDKIANEGKLPEEKARFYFKQLVEGLEHCHNNGVCHRDLKPEVSIVESIFLNDALLLRRIFCWILMEI